LSIYRPGHGRLRNGAPGAQYIPGQFGPADQGGGPGSIWRIDGLSGQISLFANVAYNGIQNTPASLGALAFDGGSQQLFVSDRATGLIHRFALDGTDRGVFDHGIQGRPVAGLPAAPFNPATLANIQTPGFDAKNSRTWGYAPAARRIFALAMHSGRLYYSVAAGEQIWSVGIGATRGEFLADARFETAIPVLHAGAEISQIAFDSLGRMYAAERGAPSGAQDFLAVADAGQNRVLRFQPKQPGDPTPGFWSAPADEYAIGLLPPYQNADGGVGLTCGPTMWSSGERLLEPGDARPGMFAYIDGLQGNSSDLVRPANAPPLQSSFVNYYDHQADPESRGHMGSIAPLNVCHGSTPPPPASGCPEGTFAVDGGCFLERVCPQATIWRNGYCVYPHCSDGFVSIRGECRQPPLHCRRDEVYFNDRCVPIGCPPRLERATNGYCRCPRDLVYRDGQCVPPPCPPDQHRNSDGRCVPNCPSGETAAPNCPCPPDQHRNSDGRCVPNCPPGETAAPNCPCPPDQHRNSDGRCVPNCPPGISAVANCPKPCPDGEKRNADGRCYKPQVHCAQNQVLRDGRCVTIVHRTPRCARGERFDGRRCVSLTRTGVTIVTPPTRVITRGCGRGEIYRDGRCVSVGGSNGSGRLGCDRAVFDRLGHCPTGNEGTTNGSGHTILRPIHKFEDNGRGRNDTGGSGSDAHGVKGTNDKRGELRPIHPLVNSHSESGNGD
jgi:hypothetical protein